MDISEARHWFSALIFCAIILFVVESFIPGGILGVFGIFALVAAIVIGYQAFDPYGTVVAVIISLSTIVLFILWLKILPKTWIAKKITISKNLHDAHATSDNLETLRNMNGVTLCKLHPGGFARINGKKIDVITQGEMIDEGENIRVIDIESNRVVVGKV